MHTPKRRFFALILAASMLAGCGGGGSDDSPPQETTPAATPPAEQISPHVIHSFLWKPQSHNDGRLVVLVDPENVRAEVTGAISETLVNTGASNGRGSTLRGSFGGCSYGNEVKIEFFDGQGRRIKLADGRDSVTVAQGCVRYEFVI